MIEGDVEKVEKVLKNVKILNLNFDFEDYTAGSYFWFWEKVVCCEIRFSGVESAYSS